MSIFGTRPEMIKMCGTLKLLDLQHFDHVMVHTGQNYKKELKDFFFKDLEIRDPDYNLEINTSNYGHEVADVIKKSYELMAKVKPDALLILGDTYSCLSVMPAAHFGIKIFHMEAGLRAWDKRMPEQRNRILIDHMSSILFPFNNYHRENLIRENIHPSKIFVTGNPTFEVMRNYSDQINSSEILKKLKIKYKDYFLVTCHRSENVDHGDSIIKLMNIFSELSIKYKKKIIFPMHPRTMKKVGKKNSFKGIEIIKPLGFYDFNKLLKDSFCVLSDSGTAPEECLFYKVANVSIRYSTERPETIESGGSIVAGLSRSNILDSVKLAINKSFTANYNFDENHSPSAVVVNAIQSDIKNFF
jgi:UDP-N-acetylglucosamine 2-epimerase (non-hydrolysing)